MQVITAQAQLQDQRAAAAAAAQSAEEQLEAAEAAAAEDRERHTAKLGNLTAAKEVWECFNLASKLSLVEGVLIY